ncbi:MAG TPA: hypothetical protein VIP70_10080 [Nitrososphaeraceae archaeon]
MRPVLKRDYSPKNWEAGGDDKTAILDIPHDIFYGLIISNMPLLHTQDA